MAQFKVQKKHIESVIRRYKNDMEAVDGTIEVQRKEILAGLAEIREIQKNIELRQTIIADMHEEKLVIAQIIAAQEALLVKIVFIP